MYKTIRTPLANLYKNHSFKSEQVSQALMGENVKVLDSYDSWYKIEQWDYYESWVHSFYLVDYLEKSNDTYFFDNHTNELICDSGDIVYVPFGVSLPKLNFDKNIVTVLMPSRCTAKYIIPDSKIFNSKVDRLIYNATKFIGVLIIGEESQPLVVIVRVLFKHFINLYLLNSLETVQCNLINLVRFP